MSCIHLVSCPDPSYEERGLMTIERFLGCAQSAVSTPNKPMKWRCNYSLIQKSRLLTCPRVYNCYKPLLATTKEALNSHQTLYLVRGWGLRMRLALTCPFSTLPWPHPLLPTLKKLVPFLSHCRPPRAHDDVIFYCGGRRKSV